MSQSLSSLPTSDLMRLDIAVATGAALNRLARLAFEKVGLAGPLEEHGELDPAFIWPILDRVPGLRTRGIRHGAAAWLESSPRRTFNGKDTLQASLRCWIDSVLVDQQSTITSPASVSSSETALIPNLTTTQP